MLVRAVLAWVSLLGFRVYIGIGLRVLGSFTSNCIVLLPVFLRFDLRDATSWLKAFCIVLRQHLITASALKTARVLIRARKLARRSPALHLVLPLQWSQIPHAKAILWRWCSLGAAGCWMVASVGT